MLRSETTANRRALLVGGQSSSQQWVLDFPASQEESFAAMIIYIGLFEDISWSYVLKPEGSSGVFGGDLEHVA